MNTRRMFSIAALGAAASVLLDRRGLSQPAEQQTGRTGSLQDRGAPRGRVGAATRGNPSEFGDLTLDLVAPLQGTGLTSIDQPSLYYVLSGRTTRPMRIAISTPGRSRPLADFELPPAQRASLGVVHLSDRGVRLSPKVRYVWSVAVVLDPNNPSRDLVGSAPIEFRPASPNLERAAREAPPERRHAVIAQAGYFYNAVSLAVANSDRDGAAAVVELLAKEGLRMTADTKLAGPGPNAAR